MMKPTVESKGCQEWREFETKHTRGEPTWPKRWISRGFEIPDDFLESIAGGELTQESKDAFRDVLKRAKYFNVSVTDLVTSLAESDDPNARELYEYYRQVWDTL